MGTLLIEPRTFSCYLAFCWRQFSETPKLVFTTNALRLVQVCLRSVNNEGHLTYKTKNSGLYLAFFKKFFWNSKSTTPAHVLKLVQVWLRSVNKEVYFTWGTKKFPCCISPSIRGSVSKLHIYLIMLMLYNWYGFGCDMSITKATLLRVQKTPRLCLVFYSEDVFRTPYLLLVTHEFGCDLSITKGTLLIEQITFSSEIRLLFKPPPPTPNFPLTTPSLHLV